jgi:ATP-dependent helicase/DNAse subunit B
MSTQILIAPPASGKTRTCIQAIQSLLAQHPDAKASVIVRDRLQANYFRSRLAAAGGAMNVRIETFRDLYLEIIDQSNLLQKPQISAAMQYWMVQASVDRANLTYFAPLRGLPGLTRSMQSLIAELQRALVTPDDLIAQADPARSGHTELARVYQSHLDLLDTIGWMDPEGLASEALRALADCPRVHTDWDLMIVDGFDWFETAQIRVLQALSGCVHHMLITLPGDPRWSRPVHRRFAQSYSDLSRFIPLQVLAEPASIQLPEALAALEARLFETSTTTISGKADTLQLLEARSPQEETREALRWIKARIVRDRVSPDQCAVLVHDPDAYFPFLRQYAAEFGLPIRFSQGRRLVDSPVISVMLNLLSLPANNFPRRALLDALRSPFFDFSELGLERDQVDVLDLISRHGKVIEGVDQWAEVFAALEQSVDDTQESEAAAQDEDGAHIPTLPRGSAARRLWEALQRVCTLLAPPQDPAHGTMDLHGLVQWLENLLAALRFYEAGQPFENNEVRSALLALRDALQGLLAAETALAGLIREENETAADPPGVDYPGLGYPSFLSTLESVLEGAGYLEDPRPNEKAIQVMRVLESRGLRFDTVAILGLSEGGFPRVERPDPILDEAIRQRLGMNLRLEQDQASLFYQAVTRADGALLLTRPYLAESGDPWEASPYWNAVKAIFPGNVRLVRPEDIRPLSEAASLQEALFWSARQGIRTDQDIPEDFNDLKEPYTRVLLAKNRLDQLLGHDQNTAEAGTLLDLVHARLGTDTVWSVSRLEQYLACPNRFFIESFLGLEAHEPPDWDYDPAQLGSLLHAILEGAYHRASDPANAQNVLAVLPEVAEQAFAEAPARFGFRPSPLWEQQRAELLERLADTIVGLAELEGGWRPLRFEQAFGFHGTPPLILGIGGRRVRLHGYIDRIDINEAGELRVIDYKTGSSHLAARDLVEGRRLQLAVYALAARDALGLGNPIEGFYWRIGSKGRSGLQLSKFEHEAFAGPEGALAMAQEHIDHALEGVQAALFPQSPLDGKCSAYCVAASWCWRYEPE